MNTFSFRPRFISAVCLATLGVASFLAPRAFAAPPPVTVTQPVQVQVVNSASAPAQVEVAKTVSVQGAVETLNDALRQPYIQSGGAQIQHSNTDATATLLFYVPAGKRLVIETVTVRTAITATSGIDVSLNVGGTQLSLAVQSQGSAGGGYSGTHPIKLLVDGPADSSVTAPTFSITADYSNVSVIGSLKAAVAGYLVDL